MKNLWEEYGVPADPNKIPWAIDLRHVNLLRELVEIARPKVAMEIGSYQGGSTVAFLKAMDELPEMHLHLVEPKPTPSLLRIIAASRHKERITLHKCASWETGVAADFVFIDGDHQWPALADLSYALAMDVPAITMHDTHAICGGCWGAVMAGEILRDAPLRQWQCDDQERPGELTHRGFALSFTRGEWSFDVEEALEEVFSLTLA